MKSLALIPLLMSVLAALALGGCASESMTVERNRLTTGQVQLTLRKDETTQAEVLDAFGAPNLVTTDSNGEEVWTYQRHATVANASNSSTFATIILLGTSSQKSGFEQSSRTMTLIIKFKETGGTKRVSSFNSRASSF